MAKGLFIIGTDTGIGKTAVSCGLAHLWSKRGTNVQVLKPFECGDPSPSDSQALWEAAGGQGERPEVVSPCRFTLPLAPAVAARKMNRAIDLKAIDAAFQSQTAKAGQNGVVLVEGCGGLLVPLLPKDLSFTVAALALRWHLPVLIVGRAGLGTLNHTMLTVERCRSDGLAILGIVLNHVQTPSPADSSWQDNGALLGEWTGLPVYGPLPFVLGRPWEQSAFLKPLSNAAQTVGKTLALW